MIFILLAACATLPPAAEPTPQLVETQAPALPPDTNVPQVPPVDPQNLVSDAARRALTTQLGIGQEQIKLVDIEPVEWPDSCLGVPAPQEMCAELIVPGYRGTLLVEQPGVYEFHSDSEGQQVRFVPPAVLAARQLMAQQLGRPALEIALNSLEKVEWPDSCVGAGRADEICALVITPGYRAVFSNRLSIYTYHLDESGSVIRLVEAPLIAVEGTLLRWQGQDGGQCVELEASLSMAAFGQCGRPLLPAAFASPGRMTALGEFVNMFIAFEAETPAGKVNLNSAGLVQATIPQQRAIAEWAYLVYQEAQGGRSGAAWGLAMAYSRHGGIAGFCDDVGIYRNGEVFVSTCNGAEPRTFRLTAAQLQSLYFWLDNYASFEYEQKDKAVADAMAVRVAFYGQGKQEFGDGEKMGIGQLLSEFANRANLQPDLAGQESAEQALLAYLQALASGDYSAAVALYGGNYEVLQDNNPGIAKEDRHSLFEAGCTINGFVCNLAVKTIVYVNQLSRDEFRFSLELKNPDGSLFERGPCCGADPADSPPETQFDFIVKNVDGKYLVMDLPIYMP
jgi:hypothetical protein